jgi:hypothetical protein
MKRHDQSRKEINLEKSQTRELKKLKELQLHGRLANRWVKGMFRDKYESFGENMRYG